MIKEGIPNASDTSQTISSGIPNAIGSRPITPIRSQIAAASSETW